MAFTATIDGMVFDLGQSGITVRSAGGSLRYDFGDMKDYFGTGPSALSQQYSTFENSGVAYVYGTSSADYVRLHSSIDINIYGRNVRNVVDLGAGDDYLDASNQNRASYINGGAGNDTIYGSNSDDTIMGGAGDDLIYTYIGGGVTDGGDGNDTIFTGGGGGTITGGNGNDVIIIASTVTMSETASGGNGNDYLRGDGDGADYLYGDAGHDTLEGGAGNDVLNGGANNDRLVGGAGDDTLDGGTGNDLLIGGPGRNVLTGGAGADVFGINAGPSHDDILDFTPGVDKIRIDLAIARNFATLDAVTNAYNDGGWGVIEFADGHLVRLSGIDATTMNASWFQFAFV